LAPIRVLGSITPVAFMTSLGSSNDTSIEHNKHPNAATNPATLIMTKTVSVLRCDDPALCRVARSAPIRRSDHRQARESNESSSPGCWRTTEHITSQTPRDPQVHLRLLTSTTGAEPALGLPPPSFHPMVSPRGPCGTSQGSKILCLHHQFTDPTHDSNVRTHYRGFRPKHAAGS
jgi:hypothetical protein